MNPLTEECGSQGCTPETPALPHLTPKQVQLLKLLSEGKSNKEVATAAGITPGTAKVYFSRLYRAIGVTTRFEAALWAVRHLAQLESVTP
jgi:DNA-binding NarL/FixJ family response regulator